MTIHTTTAAKVSTSQLSFKQWINAYVNEITIFYLLTTTGNMNKWVKEWIKETITINTYIYKSTTCKTKLYSNVLFWQSCIYKPSGEPTSYCHLNTAVPILHMTTMPTFRSMLYVIQNGSYIFTNNAKNIHESSRQCYHQYSKGY